MVDSITERKNRKTIAAAPKNLGFTQKTEIGDSVWSSKNLGSANIHSRGATAGKTVTRWAFHIVNRRAPAGRADAATVLGQGGGGAGAFAEEREGAATQSLSALLGRPKDTRLCCGLAYLHGLCSPCLPLGDSAG